MKKGKAEEAQGDTSIDHIGPSKERQIIWHGDRITCTTRTDPRFCSKPDPTSNVKRRFCNDAGRYSSGHEILETKNETGQQASDLDGNRSHLHIGTKSNSLCQSQAGAPAMCELCVLLCNLLAL